MWQVVVERTASWGETITERRSYRWRWLAKLAAFFQAEDPTGQLSVTVSVNKRER